MRNLYLLAKNTLKLLLRDKTIITFIVLSLALPIIFLSFSFADSTQLRIGVVDKDGSSLSKDMIGKFEKSERFKIVSLVETDINNKVAKGDVDCALVIPAGFEEGIIDGTMQKPQVVSIKGEDTTAWLKNNIDVFVRNLFDISKVSKGDRAAFDKMYDRYKNAGFDLIISTVEDKSEKNIATLRSLGFFIMFLMMGAGSVASLMLRDKKDRTFYRVCAAPVKPRTYVLSNLIVNMLVMVFQVGIIVVLVTWFLKLSFDAVTIQLLVILVVFGIASIGLGMMVNAFSSSTLQSSTLSTLIITPTCMLGGVFWPIDFMPKTLQRISNLMPQKWAIDAVTKLQNGEAFSALWINIWILLAFAVAFLLIAAYKIKTSEKIADFV